MFALTRPDGVGCCGASMIAFGCADGGGGGACLKVSLGFMEVCHDVASISVLLL